MFQQLGLNLEKEAQCNLVPETIDTKELVHCSHFLSQDGLHLGNQRNSNSLYSYKSLKT